MSKATLDRPAVKSIKKDKAVAAPTLACPHCKKQFAPQVDVTQPPRLQGAKCPNCKLFVPERIVAAAFSLD